VICELDDTEMEVRGVLANATNRHTVAYNEDTETIRYFRGVFKRLFDRIYTTFTGCRLPPILLRYKNLPYVLHTSAVKEAMLQH
jgi:hypothetical protein